MNSQTDKFIFILNPAAGRGRTAEMGDKLQVQLANSGLDFELHRTTQPRHARDLARAKAANNTCLVACGGDGTTHEVLNGLIAARQDNPSCNAKMSILAAGTGNDFVKNLQIPTDISRFVDVLKRGATIKADVGLLEVDGEFRCFFGNNVGIGFDGYVNIVSSQVKRLSGMKVYLYAVLKTLFRYDHPTVTLSADSRTEHKKILLINVGNGVCSGGGFYLTPRAEINDGLFDVCIINSVSKVRLLMALPKVLKGTHLNLEEVDLLRSRTLQLDSTDDLPIHADGEIIAARAHTVRIEILPDFIEIVTTKKNS